MENLNVPEHEIEGILQTLSETGLKGIMKYSDVLVLNHLVERGFISDKRDELIKILKDGISIIAGYQKYLYLIKKCQLLWKIVII